MSYSVFVWACVIATERDVVKTCGCDQKRSLDCMIREGCFFGTAGGVEDLAPKCGQLQKIAENSGFVIAIG